MNKNKTFYPSYINQKTLINSPPDKTLIQLKNKTVYLILKRIMDISLSLMALIVFFPVMLIVAFLIVLDDPKAGPIFVQKRVGLNGKVFNFYKFRTMCADAEEKKSELLEFNEMNGPVFKIKNDPRITKIGAFLRKSSIDELPQLINVIKGEMSLVGPRPAIPCEVEKYDDYAKQRLLILPGLSCYWQIQPSRNDLSFEEWMDLDIKYIKERSLLVDIKIILATFGAVIGLNGV